MFGYVRYKSNINASKQKIYKKKGPEIVTSSHFLNDTPINLKQGDHLEICKYSIYIYIAIKII